MLISFDSPNNDVHFANVAVSVVALSRVSNKTQHEHTHTHAYVVFGLFVRSLSLSESRNRPTHMILGVTVIQEWCDVLYATDSKLLALTLLLIMFSIVYCVLYVLFSSIYKRKATVNDGKFNQCVFDFIYSTTEHILVLASCVCLSAWISYVQVLQRQKIPHHREWHKLCIFVCVCVCLCLCVFHK